MTRRAWTVRLAAAAEADFQEILDWTARRFGTDQAAAYAETLAEAMTALADDGPQTIGAKDRSEIGKDLHTLHVARQRRRGRHFILFRVGEHEGAPVVDVLRLLHDSMDLARHLPPDERGAQD